MKMPLRSRAFAVAVLSLLILCLAACSSAPKKETVEVRIAATADVNPDLDTRASPIILHVMELTAIDKFNRADYFSLTQGDAAALGSDLLSKTEYILTPGAAQVAALELNSATAYLGFVAGYRDIDSALWRVAQEVLPGKTNWIGVTLGRSQVSISEVDE